MKKVRQLETFPFSASSLDSVMDFHTNYRFLVCGNYIVFYHVENDSVHVVRDIYGRRDYMRTLFGNLED